MFNDMLANSLLSNTPSTYVGQMAKTGFFLKVGMLHIKVKGVKRRTPTMQVISLTLHTPWHFVGLKGQILKMCS